jgi:hypothetical protein
LTDTRADCLYPLNAARFAEGILPEDFQEGGGNLALKLLELELVLRALARTALRDFERSEVGRIHRCFEFGLVDLTILEPDVDDVSTLFREGEALDLADIFGDGPLKFLSLLRCEQRDPGDSDEEAVLIGGAEGLDVGLLETTLFRGFPDLCCVRCGLEGDDDLGAALEVDAEIEPERAHKDGAGKDDQNRQDDERLLLCNEIEACAWFNDLHLSSLVFQMLSVAGLKRSLMMSKHNRVTTTAVKTDAMMPMSSVMAKPLIGPEPYCIKTMPAMPVVMLASMTAESALP